MEDAHTIIKRGTVSQPEIFAILRYISVLSYFRLYSNHDEHFRVYPRYNIRLPSLSVPTASEDGGLTGRARKELATSSRVSLPGLT